jgi:RNA polymerase sigma-70 factor (ECF subfamily)
MQNDHELIQDYQNGNLSAFDEIVRRHLSNTIGFFFNITRDQMASEDLAQDVFYKLYRHLKNRININTVNTWLTRNKWKNFLHLEEAPDRGEHDTSLENEWTRKELWDAIAKLPKKQRTVVMMRIAQDLPYKEISEITGMSVGSAKVNYHHAVSSLKEWLSNE